MDPEASFVLGLVGAVFMLMSSFELMFVSIGLACLSLAFSLLFS
jgi:hypothetical protein